MENFIFLYSVKCESLASEVYMPKPIGVLPYGSGNYFLFERFASQTLLWQLEFGNQTRIEQGAISKDKMKQK